jgi:hypothetical protein
MLGLFLLVSDRDGYEQERPRRWRSSWKSLPGHRFTASGQDDCCDGEAGRSHDGSHAEGLAEAAVESGQAWHVALHMAGDDRGDDGESDRPPTGWVMLMRPPATPEYSASMPLTEAMVSATKDRARPAPMMRLGPKTSAR